MTKLTLSLQQAESILREALIAMQFPAPIFAAHATIWLEACDYPGLQNLKEAVVDMPQEIALTRDKIGLDLHNISCARIGERIHDDILKNGRAFLRNVRHGLFLVPASVVNDISIGCAVDAGFALGGPRLRNPYIEKLNMAEEAGVHLNRELWNTLTGVEI